MKMNIEPQVFREKIFKRLPKLQSLGFSEIPNQKFWDFYKENKELFHKACIIVQKSEDGWQIIAKDFVDTEIEYLKKIGDMLKQHRESMHCKKCRKHITTIEKHIMKNNTILYRFLCTRCKKFKRYPQSGGALPHELAKYLKDEFQFKIIPREIQ